MKSFQLCGTVPLSEPCVYLGANRYKTFARLEIRVLISQLKRMFPEWEEKQIKFVATQNSHDFGTYFSVDVEFDELFAGSEDYAMKVENNHPDEWDEIAKQELSLVKGYKETVKQV
jgi:hypothetical protein